MPTMSLWPMIRSWESWASVCCGSAGRLADSASSTIERARDWDSFSAIRRWRGSRAGAVAGAEAGGGGLHSEAARHPGGEAPGRVAQLLGGGGSHGGLLDRGGSVWDEDPPSTKTNSRPFPNSRNTIGHSSGRTRDAIQTRLRTSRSGPRRRRGRARRRGRFRPDQSRRALGRYRGRGAGVQRLRLLGRERLARPRLERRARRGRRASPSRSTTPTRRPARAGGTGSSSTFRPPPPGSPRDAGAAGGGPAAPARARGGPTSAPPATADPARRRATSRTATSSRSRRSRSTSWSVPDDASAAMVGFMTSGQLPGQRHLHRDLRPAAAPEAPKQ